MSELKMIIGYKLVTQKYTTHGGMIWKIGKTNQAQGEGVEMCTAGVLHYYEHPTLAVLFNPIHANIPNPKMLKIKCSEKVAGDGLKAASKKQTPIEEISIPTITTQQRVAFAIRCALAVYLEKSFVCWATQWLSGEDRTRDSAHIACAATANTSAAYAVKSVYAAHAAAHAAAQTTAENTTYAAARTAVYVVYAAAGDAHVPNFVSIIEEVMKGY